MAENYVILIEIDQETGDVVLTKEDGKQYYYSVGELDEMKIIDRELGSGISGTVYSQGERFTFEEYKELFGEVPDYLLY